MARGQEEIFSTTPKMTNWEQEYSWFKLKEKESRPNPLVAIIGPQGVGKTTLTEILRIQAGFQPVFEDFSGLESLLKELNGYKRALNLNPDDQEIREKAQALASNLEIIFLNRKAGKGADVKKLSSNEPVVLDVDVLGDVIYVMTYERRGLLRPEQVAFYLKQLEIVREVMPAPDLYIGLQVSPDVLVERNRRRGREFEEALPAEELHLMAEISNKLIVRAQTEGWPILPINTDEWDFANNRDHQKEVASMIFKRLNS